MLQVISSSPSNLQPVFEAMLEKAVRICDAKFGNLWLREGDVFRIGAIHGAPAEWSDFLRREPTFRVDPRFGLGRLTATKQSYQVADIADEPTHRDKLRVATIELARARSLIGVPLLRDDEVIGAFAIYRQEVRPFTDKQTEVVENFAAQAVIAIENARLFEAEQQRTRELAESLEQQTATSQVLQVISSSPGQLQPVFDAILDNAVRICESQNATLWLQQGGKLRRAARYREVPDAIVPSQPSVNSALARAVRTKQILHIPDYRTDQSFLDRDQFAVAAADQLGIRTNLCVPMVKEGESVGAISIYRTEVRPFTEKQIELIASFASQAVIAIENARLLNELRQSLEQQTATSKVLDVISRSAFDLKAVFEAVAESSVKLCGADRAFFYRFDGELLRVAAGFNAPKELTEYVEQTPIRPGRNSASARAALERRTVHVPDCLADPEYSWGGKDVSPVRTVLAVPVLKGDELLGTIVTYRLEVRPFTDKQIALVETFADQSAIAIENVRLLDELRQRTSELGRSVEELRALGEVSQAVNSTLELETVLSTIVANAVQLSSTDAGAIYVFNDQQREFRLRATYGMDRELIEALTQRHIGLDEPNFTHAFLAGEPTQVPDLREAVSSAANDIVLRAGFRALLIAPLLRGEHIIGMLVVRRRTPGTFPRNTIDLIKTFAAQSAVAIENARLFQDVETSLEDLRATQNRLVQTQKLASLGQLTAGIAHEIKNPLNFVNNFSGVSVELIDELQQVLPKVKADASTLAEITELTDTLRDNLNKIVQHGKRADSIVKNMLLHSREGSGEHRAVDINALVEEALNLAYHGARAEKQGFNITLERSFDPAAGEVDVFPQEITRVLLNLIANGFYAATQRQAQANSDGYEPTLAAATKNLGEQVEISIRDNGIGVSPEIRDKVFNPFFTTKPAGEGTGLGLSLSHDIVVKQHSGSIEIVSQPGEFTEFKIRLPRSAASLAKSGERS